MNTEITHALYKKKMPIKYIAYEQAMMLGQYIRDDENYVPFLIQQKE